MSETMKKATEMLWEMVGQDKVMSLATRNGEEVASRTVNGYAFGGRLYFITEEHSNKYAQITANPQMAFHEGVHQPIVDRDTWEQVQKTFENKRRKPKQAERNMFAGYLRCSDCGGNLRYKYTHQNPDNHYFSCGNNRDKLCPSYPGGCIGTISIGSCQSCLALRHRV